MTASLAYRKNEAAILAGNAPEKYTRLLEYIPRGRIVEAGSAEGVLALLLAKRGDEVTAIEKSAERHKGALALARRWGVSASFVNGAVAEHLDALDGADVFLAVRAIYYWGDDLDRIFSEVSKKVPTVVLCGNKNRAAAWHAGTPHEPLGEMNRYASAVGMAELLERHGYTVVRTELGGDPIVVGKN